MIYYRREVPNAVYWKVVRDSVRNVWWESVNDRPRIGHRGSWGVKLTKAALLRCPGVVIGDAATWGLIADAIGVDREFPGRGALLPYLREGLYEAVASDTDQLAAEAIVAIEEFRSVVKSVDDARTALIASCRSMLLQAEVLYQAVGKLSKDGEEGSAAPAEQVDDTDAAVRFSLLDLD